jgi:hypothetical protein
MIGTEQNQIPHHFFFFFSSPSLFLSFHPNAFRFVGLGENSTTIEFPLPY